MTKEEAFKTVQDIICEELSLNPEKITMETSFETDLGADSLDIIEIIASLEDAFELSIPNEEVLNLRTVQQVVDFVVSHK